MTEQIVSVNLQYLLKTPLETNLSRHNFGIGSGNIDASIEASFVVSFHDVTTINFVSSNTAVVGALKKNNACQRGEILNIRRCLINLTMLNISLLGVQGTRFWAIRRGACPDQARCTLVRCQTTVSDPEELTRYRLRVSVCAILSN